MGHAGAWTGIGEGTAEAKYKALEGAGVTMVDHPAKFGGVMKDILAKSGRNVSKMVRPPPFHLINNLHLPSIGATCSQRSAAPFIPYLSPSSDSLHRLTISAKALPPPYGKPIHYPPQRLQYRHHSQHQYSSRVLPSNRHYSIKIHPLPLHHCRTNNQPRSARKTRSPLSLRLPHGPHI
jgi:hypothetical protein